MNEKVVDMINDRFDRFENDSKDRFKNLEVKVDSLIEFKHTWLGRVGAMAAVGTIGGSLLMAFVIKKLGWA